MSNKKFRLGALDIILIVLIVAVIAAGIAFILNQPAVAAEDDNYTETAVSYTVLFSSLDESRSHALKIGDSLYHADSGLPMGEITDIRIAPAFRRYYHAETDQIEKQELADTFDLYVTLQATATYRDSGVYIGSAPIMVGARPTLQSRNFYAGGVCTKLSAEEVSHG